MLFIAKYFIAFIFFSFIGYILEEAYGLYEEKKLVNRGFLIGPICPIYGIGCLLIYFLLNPLAYSPMLLFISSILLCTFVEYLSSYLLEKIFKVRWWDYNNMKYNINGRVCLETAIPFGLLGLLLIYVVMPFENNLLDTIPEGTTYIISTILLILFTIDELYAFYIGLKHKHNNVETHALDNTKEMKSYTKENIKKSAKKVKKKIDEKRKATK